MNKKLKPSLTFDELLEKLKLRGLIIDTPSKIENINYYFIKGYAIYGGLATKDAKYDYKFIPNLKLSDIYDIYVFDSNLKSV